LKQEIAREPVRGNANLKVSHLPFSEIPHQSRLFTTYQRDPKSLQKFYPNAVSSPGQIADYIPDMLARYHTDRDELCNALTDINLKLDAGTKTTDNIRMLRDSDTAAVVTGQQAGLFTGPLYTIYKALSAIKMAEVLNESGVKAVAVFWAATEDHDFAEVSGASFIDRSGKLVRYSYEPLRYLDDSPVGNIDIDRTIDELTENIFGDLSKTEYSDEVSDRLRASWAEGTSFGDAFLRTLATILKDFGMIFIDPLDERIKNLSAPIYARAVAQSDHITASIIARSRELEAGGFHAQVTVEENYFPLFWHGDDGRRTAIRKTGEGVYRVKGERREFTLSELEATAASEPGRFSPGVMQRPVVQDWLLPTACYFGGGAEIAYFAQNSEAYRVMDRPVTPIFHRQSFTIVENKHRRVLDKLHLDFKQMLGGIGQTLQNVAEHDLSPETSSLFADVEERINTELHRVDQAAMSVDITLADHLAKRRRKMIYHITAMKTKVMLAVARNDVTVSRQIDGLYSSLLPEGGLQERVVNVFTYLNKFGPNFIKWLYEAIDLEDKDHRIVDL